jgi:hypothetical protein
MYETTESRTVLVFCSSLHTMPVLRENDSSVDASESRTVLVFCSPLHTMPVLRENDSSVDASESGKLRVSTALARLASRRWGSVTAAARRSTQLEHHHRMKCRCSFHLVLLASLLLADVSLMLSDQPRALHEFVAPRRPVSPGLRGAGCTREC